MRRHHTDYCPLMNMAKRTVLIAAIQSPGERPTKQCLGSTGENLSVIETLLKRTWRHKSFNGPMQQLETAVSIQQVASRGRNL